jgi:DNA polymerase-1
MKTFFLIDGHAQFFRAYYAPFPPLNSPSGEPTKAVHVFTQMLLSILDEKKPEYLAVAMDHGDESTVRRALYPEYKANRDRTPEDLPPQIERIVEILTAMGIPVWSVPGFEADDIIATTAKLLENEDIELRVVSRDKDLHQILSDRVRLWDPQTDTILDAGNLLAEKGYTPAQAVEIQTLTGDSTDNVPGIAGVGPKKAVDLIQRYGTADAVLANASELTPKMRENVLAAREILPLTRELVTLRRDVEFPFELGECEVSRFRRGAVRPILQSLGLRRLLEQLDKGGPASGEAPVETSAVEPGADSKRRPTNYRLVATRAELDEFLTALRGVKSFAVDTETSSLSPIDSELVGMSFSWNSGEGWYLALRSSRGETLDPTTAIEALRPILEDPDIEKCGQNIKFDLEVLRSAGVSVRGVTFDSMVASYLLLPERRSHGMDALARDILHVETIPITDLIGTGKNQSSMLDVELDRLTTYAAEDADITWRLRVDLEPRFTDPALTRLFHEVEMPLVEVLADMEFRGVSLDSAHLEAYSRVLRERIQELVEEIHAAAGRKFSIDSPKQLAEVLFDELAFPVIKRTKTSRSTDASVLETFAADSPHPLPRLVLEYRELTKLEGTYVAPLPSLVSAKTGRLHASFHQAVAATGRLSSSDPNLQNIPIRTEQGREIRKAFIAKDRHHVLITADYSQIELRILAHMSEDPALLEAFRTDQDVHTVVASQIFGVPLDKVTSEQRGRAKAVNFGIIYGQGAFGLSRSLRIPRAVAAKFIEEYRTTYRGITDFVAKCIAQAETTGHATTLLGRRRPIPEIASQNRALRAQGERLAVNTVVQGTAADLIKVAMVNIHRRIRSDLQDLALLIQVHDELVFEAPRSRAAEYAKIVETEMANAITLSVPLRVDTAWGDNWLEGKG